MNHRQAPPIDAEQAERPLRIAIGSIVEGESKDRGGILLSSFDPASATFGEVTLGARYGNSATFLCLHPTLPLLYSVGRSDQFPDGSVAVFAINARSLDLRSEASSGGSTPCHLAIDEFGATLAVANYDDGTTYTLALDERGLPISTFSTRTIGGGPSPNRQEGSHPHGVYFRGKTLHVPDLELDRIQCWTIQDARPEWETLSVWQSVPGAGPRHMAFSPDGRHAYVANELDSTVSALTINAGSGCFETINHVSTLPEGEVVNNTTAEIAIHPNGRFVYVSNRGHDSIAVFARDAGSGELKRILVAPAGGKNPRHFVISPDANWILCAHQDSDTIVALPLDGKSGMIGNAVAAISCPKPICVIFLE
ncbi:lactonase family protein [Luteolibacter soli]|uniref:Lactonase family protein n=1 Tax=Luteolibacter soli TaxID=3135280 RepID=A0ABU9AZX0_9BACT